MGLPGKAEEQPLAEDARQGQEQGLLSQFRLNRMPRWLEEALATHVLRCALIHVYLDVWAPQEQVSSGAI